MGVEDQSHDIKPYKEHMKPHNIDGEYLFADWIHGCSLPVGVREMDKSLSKSY